MLSTNKSGELLIGYVFNDALNILCLYNVGR